MNDTAASIGDALEVDAQTPPEVVDTAEKLATERSDAVDFDLGRWLINLFIIFHVTAIVVWNLPVAPVQQTISSAVQGYLTVTGCWQSWSMFSPDPVSMDTYCGAIIHYQDGSIKNYTYPRIYTMGIGSKYRLERWRKFLENTSANTASNTWPYLARYAVLVNDPTPKTNPPVSVDVYRYQRMIAPNNSPPVRYIPTKLLSEKVSLLPSTELLGIGK